MPGVSAPLVTNDDCSGTDKNFCITWVATFTGDVVLQVDSPTLSSGDYFLFAKKGEPTGNECTPDPFEPDDLCGDAPSIVVDENGRSEDHSICGLGDVDSYIFAAQSGKRYTFASFGTTDVKAIVTTTTCVGSLASASTCDPGDPNFCLTSPATSNRFYVLRVQV